MCAFIDDDDDDIYDKDDMEVGCMEKCKEGKSKNLNLYMALISLYTVLLKNL